MKKLVVYLCVGVMVLGLTACGGGKDDNTQNNQNTVEATATPAPTEEPVATQEPAATEAPAEGEQAQGTDMSAVRQAVVDVLGENYWPNMEIPAEYMEGFGLTADMYDGFFGEMPMINTNVDTLIVIQAKEGQLDAVEEVVNGYRENLVNDTMQYPMNLGKIQASRIETFGNYVCFVQLGADTMDIYGEDGNEEAVIKHCQEQNELALEAISKVLGQ
ncbi:MAG: DUF4358 domain-containing protein [Lachnospiraceae bacterium]|nr:DUF4358 domain-containing protein [Lachnospiraceae bacterium]